VGSHLVFFKSNASGVVDVVRILNQRMDVFAHL
jgi:plasmid stabilization system protein ParE